MHPLNNPDVITHEFFSKCATVGQLRVDQIYNKVYGIIPTILKCTEPFEEACVTDIAANFDILYSEMTTTGTKVLEETMYAGKYDTAYENIFLSVSHSGNDGGFSFKGEMAASILSEAIQEKRKVDIYVSVTAACQSREQVKLVLDLLSPHRVEKKSKIYMLSSSYGDLSFSALALPAHNADLALNYGKKFPEFHNKLVESLNDKQSGLYLFYGPPGTGKSSYIKHLLSGDISRKVAYIPVSMIQQLVSPDMLPLLTENKNIILVLEDAEKALVSREIAENSAIVSTILNLTDGFIGQALNITVIATFNTAKEQIDEALLRKGRLRMSYEFNKLSVEDGKTLAESLGIDPRKIKEEMSLADIYNFEDNTGYEKPEERHVGFR